MKRSAHLVKLGVSRPHAMSPFPLVGEGRFTPTPTLHPLRGRESI
jgi:hypothetical protein